MTDKEFQKTELKTYYVWHDDGKFHCVIYAKNVSNAKRKAINRMIKTKGIKTSAKVWNVSEFKPRTYGGCLSFDLSDD